MKKKRKTKNCKLSILKSAATLNHPPPMALYIPKNEWYSNGFPRLWAAFSVRYTQHKKDKSECEIKSLNFNLQTRRYSGGVCEQVTIDFSPRKRIIYIPKKT